MTNDLISKVDEILRNAQGNPLDIYAVLYRECILGSENPSAILQQILQFDAHPIGSEDDDSPAVMSAAQEKRIKQSYSVLAKVIARTLARENLPVEQFYGKLYTQIFTSELFPSDEKVKIVILKTLSEEAPEVPYFQAVDSLSMTNEDFQAAVDRVDGYIDQALHMLNRHFESRTVEASQLCRIASEISDKNDQIVYWSIVISILKDGPDK